MPDATHPVERTSAAGPLPSSSRRTDGDCPQRRPYSDCLDADRGALPQSAPGFLVAAYGFGIPGRAAAAPPPRPCWRPPSAGISSTGPCASLLLRDKAVPPAGAHAPSHYGRLRPRRGRVVDARADGTKEGSKQDGAERGAQRRALRLARGRALRGGHNAACDAKVLRRQRRSVVRWGPTSGQRAAHRCWARVCSGNAFSFLASLFYVLDLWSTCMSSMGGGLYACRPVSAYGRGRLDSSSLMDR
jgi:hypothetical protein